MTESSQSNPLASALPIKDTTNFQNMTTETKISGKRWRCDVCQEACFDDFNEACRHEEQCAKMKKQQKELAIQEGHDPVQTHSYRPTKQSKLPLAQKRGNAQRPPHTHSLHHGLHPNVISREMICQPRYLNGIRVMTAPIRQHAKSYPDVHPKSWVQLIPVHPKIQRSGEVLW